ncbi:unnamed protein product [Allacma fusca]|uniref:Peptidase M14 domain-containing protein n=1 Tax=Allacma fusca TaxID=39272 RepID=A0A8J2PTR1_9HEXA|nr:unnamed protein product [Allacma fusca]
MVSTCGPFRFTSNFDSGNFHKIELLDKCRPGAGHGLDYEVNLWTKPDCYGTPYENGNRTWFHFGIRGGKPLGNLKLNILNLNKQVKLFHQGMQPVFRILPERPHWERVPDRLIVNETLDHICSISFRQRLPEDPKKSTLYIAFSYPFSYAELREWLTRLDEIFAQPIPPDFCFDRIKVPLPQDAERSLVCAALPSEDEIYYYRECACYSLEGRNIDLITVTSLYGMASEREERLLNLFPDSSYPRPFRFPFKKVVFLSARVHPGETPSTFVLNGFFKFVLERHDPRAILLRRLFVFKFIPMLNPDGVARGHYRTDPRGVNLNRVYLNPSPTLHPSIYAARKLLLYYHHGHDVPDDYEYPEDQSEPEISPECSTSKISSSGSGLTNDANACSLDGSESMLNNSSLDSGVSSSSGESIKNSNCKGEVFSDKKIKKRRKNRVKAETRKKSFQDLLSKESTTGSSSSINLQVEETAIIMIENELPVMPHDGEVETFTMENVDMDTESHQCAFEACDEDSVLYTSDVVNSNSCGAPSPVEPASSPCKSVLSEKKAEAGPSVPLPKKKKELRKKSSKGKFDAEMFGLTVRKRMGSPELKLREKTFQRDGFGSPASISRNTSKTQHRFSETPSGVFLYIDMHGHATKRGIFMYGNHFPDVATQAECMLLPRLMSMNCPHFDFPACNFTERLMNMKDRRDGASREGSGRVACLKLTNLIRSYTLECNYNTGRMVNPVVCRPPSYGFVDPPSTVKIHHSPKFTPDLFEGTGRALAESVLDLTGHNPWSRLSYTEFKTLEGMRRWISNRLLHSPEYSQSRGSSLNTSAVKEKIIPKKSCSTTGCGIASVSTTSRASSAIINTSKKRSPKKRTGSKVLVELHPHRTGTSSSSHHCQIDLIVM